MEELAKSDGLDERPAYLAYQGKIYDVSASSMFENGDHLGAHQAGADLTEALAEAPHGEEVLDGFAPIGIIKEGK